MPPIVRIDYHTHHERCGHAEGRLEDYVKRAVEIGLEQIGLSDHMPLLHVDPAEYYPGMAMPMEELPRYVEEALWLKEKYRDRIDVRVGLEGDYIEGYEEEIERIVTGYPWDYVIGSVHFLGEWDISDSRQLHGWEGKKVLEVYERYYDAVQKAAKTGFYDFLGHLDVIKRFGHRPEDEEAERELERRTLEVIREHDVAIELNASGLVMPCEDMFPKRRMLETAFALGIPVTVGSDAHRPERVALNLDRAVECLKAIGYRELATFKERQRIMVPIGP